MMKDSLNKKTYIGDIEPNPKEFGIWVKQDGTAKVYDYINNEWKGGSSNDGGDSSNIEYLDVSGFGVADDGSPTDELLNIVNAAICMKVDLGAEGKAVLTGGSFAWFSQLFGNNLYGMTKAVFIDYDLIFITPEQTMTIKEMLLSNFSQEQLDAIPRITKEEFYSLT